MSIWGMNSGKEFAAGISLMVEVTAKIALVSVSVWLKSLYF
jgi:hypothetical protein